MDVIVPYRDRDEHLKSFMEQTVPRILEHPHNHVIIVEQSHDRRQFNRGALLNIGFQEVAQPQGLVCFHDVDLEPSQALVHHFYPPSTEEHIVHLASCWHKPRYTKESYLGGALVVPRLIVEQCNGFPNNHWGWGGEDDEFARRLKLYDPVITRVVETPHIQMYDLERLSLKQKMAQLRQDRAKNTIKWELHDQAIEAKEGTNATNGLGDLSYYVIMRETLQPRVEHLVVHVEYNSQVLPQKYDV